MPSYAGGLKRVLWHLQKKLNKKIDPLKNNRILLHMYHFFCQLIIKARLIAKKDYSSQECKLTNKFDIDKKKYTRAYFTFKIKCFNTKAFYLDIHNDYP